MSRGYAHLMQAFRFPSEPGAGIVRKQPSDMTCEGPLYMSHHRCIRCGRRLRSRSGQRKRAKELGVSVMIGSSRSTELPFDVRQRAVLPIDPFDLEFPKALKHRSVLYDGHLVERDICDGGMVHAHTDAGSPDSQGRDWHELPLSKREKEQIAKHRWWKRLAIDQLNFLPVLHQGKFQLPGLFPALDSMPKCHPCAGQIATVPCARRIRYTICAEYAQA